MDDTQLRGQQPWGLNVGGLMRAYPGWRITGAFGGFGYAARRLFQGRPHGRQIVALTLDELAERMDAAEGFRASPT